MKEIKFRAWVDHSDKWNDCKPRMIYFDEKFPDLLLHPRTGEIWFNGDDDTSKKMDSKIELMQFTGLKDKNEKEIFEGDVLKSNEYFWKGSNIVVHYHKGGFFPFRFECQESSDLLLSENSEIIGNIYENPELLEQK